MRILHLGPVPKRVGGRGETGGVATHTWHLTRNLGNRGHTVAILADNYLAPTTNPVENRGVTVYGMNPLTTASGLLRHVNLVSELRDVWKRFTPIPGIKRAKLLIYYLQLKQVIADFQPDIIHAQHLQYRPPLAHMATTDEVPVVATSQSLSFVKFADESRRAARFDLFKQSLHESSNLIFISSELAEETREMFGSHDGRWEVIRNSISSSMLERPDRREVAEVRNQFDEKPTLLFVGDLTEEKGVFTLLEAVAKLQRRGQEVQVLLVGSPIEERRVESVIKSKRLGTTVELVGYAENVTPYYEFADLFVLPSTSEGFGLVFVEAMAAGTPVIGTSAVPESVIPSEEYGLRVPPEDSDTLANKIEQAFEREWNHEKISQYAEDFSWENNIEKYEEFYLTVLN